MAFRLLEAPPVVENYILLADYNAQTPESFDFNPVLHQIALAAALKIPAEQYNQSIDLQKLSGSDAPATGQDDQIHISDIDVWVTSKHMIFYANKKQVGLQVLYPSITITAQDGAEVLLELNLSSQDTADEDIEVLQLRISPNSVMYPEDDMSESAPNGAGHALASAALFKSISNCQELNPDPRLPGDEDEDGEEFFDESAPGATGWITSENMAQFMDADGNFIMPEGTTIIGNEDGSDSAATSEQGIGSVRSRAAANLDGGDEADETKWQRTG